MPLIIFLFGLICSLPYPVQSQTVTSSNVAIVDTRELMSLIHTNDDTIRLFNFWATWCKPCVRELPYFEELSQSKSKEKFRLYLVSLDFRKDYKKRLIPFLNKKKITASVLLFDGGNPNNWINTINPDWSGSIPASLIAFKGQSCFEENAFEDLNSLNIFVNRCKSNFKL